MFAEYRDVKERLVEALEGIADDVDARTSIYALVQTGDPQVPFDVKWVRKAGQASADAGLVNQRLFDNAFLDYGFHELRDEDNLEGVVYAPLEDKLTDPECIGVASLDFFDVDQARVRMAAGADEDPEEEDADALRFLSYLKLVDGRVRNGEPQERLSYESVVDVKGLLFRYECGKSAAGPLIAFQRTQPMWVQKKSNMLLFGREGSSELFADRSLKIGTGFDFLHFENKLLFASTRALELLFAYRKLIARKAKDYADTLDALVADYEKLDERIDASRAVANRLLKIQRGDSPVPAMEAQELERHVRHIPYYNSKLKFNEEGKLMLMENKDVSDFLNLLDDDYLVSPLSAAHYESKSKKRLDKDE